MPPLWIPLLWGSAAIVTVGAVCSMYAPAMPWKQRSRRRMSLRRLWPPDGQEKEECHLNIVIVPAINASPVRSLQLSSWKWLKSLVAEEGIRARIFVFEYEVQNDVAWVWQALEQAGSDLLEDLLIEQGDHDLLTCPLVFVCHGLGGTVVKRALSSTHGYSSNPRLGYLWRLNSGIVFLGTPHPTLDHSSRWSQLTHVLRAETKLSRLAMAHAEQELVTMAGISRTFQESGIDVPVICVYEAPVGGRFMSRRTVPLVDKDFIYIGLPKEDDIPCHKPHLDLCKIEVKSTVYEQVRRLVRAAGKGYPAAKRWLRNADDEKGQGALPLEPTTSPMTDDGGFEQVSVPSHNSRGNTRDDGQVTARSSDFVVLTTINDIHRPRPGPNLPCRMFSTQRCLKNFKGRSDVLQEIKNTFWESVSPGTTSPHRRVPRSFALHGTPGMGKTSIASQYVDLNSAKYDAIFWVQAETAESISNSFTQIAINVGLLKPGEERDAVISKNVVMNWLSMPFKEANSDNEEGSSILTHLANWLLVFDNANKLEILDDYWPLHGTGHILVTSRNPASVSYKTNEKGRQIRPLDSAAAIDLMISLTRPFEGSEDQRCATELVHQLDAIPIMLTQIAGLMQVKGWSFPEFLRIYSKQGSRIKILSREKDYGHRLLTKWGIESLQPDAKALLFVMSLLDSEEIKEVLFTDLPAGVAESFLTDELEYLNARSALVSGALIGQYAAGEAAEGKADRSPTKEGHLSIHRSVQEFALIHASRTDLRDAFGIAVGLLLKNWPKSPHLFAHDSSIPTKSSWLVLHVQRLSQLYEAHPEWDVSIDVLRSLVKLLGKASWTMSEQGRFDSARLLNEAALKICETHEASMPEEYADALFESGSYYYDTNQFETHFLFAERHFRQRMIVEQKREKFGLGAGMAYSEMGLAYLLRNDYEKAVEVSQRSLEINKETPDYLSNEYWPFFAIIHHAQALIGLNRDDEAVEMLQRTLRWREEKYGLNDHKDFKLGYALQVLAMIRRREGEVGESKSLYSRALQNYERTIGPTHHRYGHVLVQLAEIEAQAEHLDSARILVDQALLIFGAHDAFERETARTKYRMALFYEKFGSPVEEPDAAERFMREANVLYRKITHDLVDLDVKLAPERFDEIVAIWAR